MTPSEHLSSVDMSRLPARKGSPFPNLMPWGRGRCLVAGFWQSCRLKSQPPPQTYYDSLYSSLDVRPAESISPRLARLMSALNEPQNDGVTRKIESLIGGKQGVSVDQVLKNLCPSHSTHSEVLFRQILSVADPNEVRNAYDFLKQVVGELQTETLQTLLTRAILKGGQAGDAFAALILTIPRYIMLEIPDRLLPNVAFLGCSSENVVPIVVAMARQGAWPSTARAIAALEEFLHRSADGPKAFMEAVSAFNLGAKQIDTAAPLAVLMAKLTARIPNASEAARLLQLFISSCEQKKPTPGRRRPLSATFWTTVLQFNQGQSREPVSQLVKSNPGSAVDRDTALALRQDSVEGLFRAVTRYSVGDPTTINPRRVVSLYSQLLRCCIRDSPKNLYKELANAERHCDELFGATGSKGRQRRFLSGILQGLFHTRKYNEMAAFLPLVRKTSTPFLWNITLMALAKSEQVSKAWEIAREMNVKDLEVRQDVASQIILADIRRSPPVSELLQHIWELHSWGTYFTPDNYLNLIKLMCSGSCTYKHEDLFSFYLKLGIQLKKMQLSAFGRSGPGQKADAPLPAPVFNRPLIRQIIWSSFVKKPKEPWAVLELFIDLSKKGVPLCVDDISSEAQAVLRNLNSNSPTREARRILAQGQHEPQKLLNRFNAAWMDSKVLLQRTG